MLQPLIANVNIQEIEKLKIVYDTEFTYFNRLTVYTECAIAYTDIGCAYAQVFPRQRHRAVGKETGQTSYCDRKIAQL